jgi:protein-S-isoprenylcysteine O-methyltransferase Ste14
MENKKDSPGILIPPPFFYIALFGLSFLLQKSEPINRSFFWSGIARLTAIVLIIPGMLLFVPAVFQFVRAGTAIVPVKPASCLQTKGLYALSRNPMYTGLLMIYAGLAIFIGNWWTVLLMPVLTLIIRKYFIKREEAYLLRAFGAEYEEYKRKVRRWI